MINTACYLVARVHFIRSTRKLVCSCEIVFAHLMMTRGSSCWILGEHLHGAGDVSVRTGRFRRAFRTGLKWIERPRCSQNGTWTVTDRTLVTRLHLQSRCRLFPSSNANNFFPSRCSGFPAPWSSHLQFAADLSNLSAIYLSDLSSIPTNSLGKRAC
jgi:hypothetical protein